MDASSTLPIMVVISGNQYISRFFKDHFKSSYFVMDFSNLDAALDCVKMLYVSVIIFDQKFECLSIWDACTSLSKARRDKNAPIFLVTNFLKKTFSMQAKQSGISDFLSIPLSVEEVEQKISDQMQQETIKNKMENVRKKIPAQESASKQGYLLSIKSEDLDRLKKFLHDHLRSLDKTIFEEDDCIGVFLAKTSARAAQLIAENIQEEAPLSTVIAIQSIMEDDSLKEAFQAGKNILKTIPAKEKQIIWREGT